MAHDLHVQQGTIIDGRGASGFIDGDRLCAAVGWASVPAAGEEGRWSL
jgi:hypothetical protein